MRSEERRVFTELLLPTTHFKKIFQHHALPPATAATAISFSSVITSNINSNKLYVIDSKGSANNVSAAPC